MNRDRSRSPEAKAKTIARRNERYRKNVECSMPTHSEFVVHQIEDHRLNYGWN